jgi:hypothetical protein
MTTPTNKIKKKAPANPIQKKMSKSEIASWKKELNDAKKLEQERQAQNYCGVAGCLCGDLKAFEEFAPETPRSPSNVTFVAGSNVEETNVFVEDTLMLGVVRANLEYDPEFSLPVLKLTILGPAVSPVLH